MKQDSSNRILSHEKTSTLAPKHFIRNADFACLPKHNDTNDTNDANDDGS